MKPYLIFFAFCCSTVMVNAQIKINPGTFSSDWNEGRVVFNTGDTLNCYLRFNQAVPHGLLQVQEDGNAITIPVKDVREFSFFDPRKTRHRKFFSVPVSEDHQLTKEYFMECLYDDQKFTILKHRTIGTPYDYMNYSRFISRPSRITKQYILDITTGSVLPLSKENVLQLTGNKKPEITSFIQSNSIKFKSVTDYIHVFEYLSSL